MAVNDARRTLARGGPSRITPLGADDMDPAALARASKLMSISATATNASSIDEIPAVVAVLLHHPELYDRVTDLSIQLTGRSNLTLRDRELIILRVAWLWQGPFAWGEHVAVAKTAGISDREIDQLTKGAVVSNWREGDRALLQAVDELIGGGMISDETWAVLAKNYNEQQLIQIPATTGHFTGIVLLQNSLRIPLRPGNTGLNMR